MATTKTLNMTFGLNNGKEKTINLADPKDGLTSDEVQGFMTDVIDADALKVNGASAGAAKSAKIREVTVTELF